MYSWEYHGGDPAWQAYKRYEANYDEKWLKDEYKTPTEK